MKTLSTTLLLMLILCSVARAQNTGWYLTYNTTAALEPQAAYGLGLGYQFNESFNLTTEFSVLSKPLWSLREGAYDNLKGFRSVTTAKFLLNYNDYRDTRNYFATELRYKQAQYQEQATFTDISTKSVIKDYNYTRKISTVGAALLYVHQQPIFRDNTNIYAELSIGVGGRISKIKNTNTPANSQILPEDPGFLEMPNYATSHSSFYFPASLKLVYKF